MAWLPLTFKCHHNFATNDYGFQLLFIKNNIMHKGGNNWYHIEIISVKNYNYVAYSNMDNDTI